MDANANPGPVGLALNDIQARILMVSTLLKSKQGFTFQFLGLPQILGFGKR